MIRIKLLASLFTPHQGGGMTYLTGIFDKKKLGVLAQASFFFSLGGMFPSRRTVPFSAFGDPMGEFASI